MVYKDLERTQHVEPRMSNIITFYDIPSNKPNFAWSPNTCKTRYSLNYKSLAFKTVWVEYPDIQALCEKLGAAPTGKKADGSPFYTLPVIHDPSTGAVVSDSIVIAQYLDTTYPDTPRIIPEGTSALQYAFLKAFDPALSGLRVFLLPATVAILNPASKEYFTRTKGVPLFGKPLRDVLPEGPTFEAGWKALVDGFSVVDGFLTGGKLDGPFVMGDTVSFADFYVGANIAWMRKLWGQDSAEWKSFKTLHGGRWDRLVQALEKYEAVQVE